MIKSFASLTLIKVLYHHLYTSKVECCITATVETLHSGLQCRENSAGQELLFSKLGSSAPEILFRFCPIVCADPPPSVSGARSYLAHIRNPVLLLHTLATKGLKYFQLVGHTSYQAIICWHYYQSATDFVRKYLIEMY